MITFDGLPTLPMLSTWPFETLEGKASQGDRSNQSREPFSPASSCWHLITHSRGALGHSFVLSLARVDNAPLAMILYDTARLNGQSQSSIITRRQTNKLQTKEFLSLDATGEECSLCCSACVCEFPRGWTSLDPTVGHLSSLLALPLMVCDASMAPTHSHTTGYSLATIFTR